MSTVMGGFASNQFKLVEDTFRQIISSSPESGAAVSIWKDGKNVVDLWGGVSNRETKSLWAQDTAAVIFSCTKGLMSIAIAKLFQAGQVNYEDLATKYWPEYGKNGKANTTIKDLVAHRAGIPFFKTDIYPDEVVDWEFMISKVESEEPFWSPGQHHAYHALTHGWLAGEIIRRVSGLMPGEFLAKEIAAPLNADTWLCLAPKLENRVAYSYPLEELTNYWVKRAKENSTEGNFEVRSLTLGSAFPVTLVQGDSGFNSPMMHQAVIPGAGGISTANGLAKIWSSTVCETEGVRMINDKTLSYVTKVQTEGKPFINLDPPYHRFGMGFQLDAETSKYLTSSSFGHNGAGGQCAFADPENKIGFAFVTSEMGGGAVNDDRAARLITALRSTINS